MKILVLNCGSSSIRYQLHDVEAGAVLARGLVSRIGEADAQVDTEIGPTHHSWEGPIADHGRGLELILDSLLHSKDRVVQDKAEIAGVGHRVVHGGTYFSAPAVVSPEVLEKIEECAPLAPLHNPPAVRGIRDALRILPDSLHVAFFDTAFHSTIPARAHVYALPYEYYRDSAVRRYGFHGTSFQAVSRKVDAMLGGRLADKKVVIAHLGNGAGVAAVAGGVCVDTSMGLTPLEGLVMGTRGGDLDPGVVLFMMRQLGLSAADVDRVLNRESGLLGVSGVSNDMRDVLAAAGRGDDRSTLALTLYSYRLRKYVGALAAAMGGLDLLVFTAGVGENSPEVREAVCEGLGFLGIDIDQNSNRSARGVFADVSARDSCVRVLVVPTDEERLIAEETAAILKNTTKAIK